MDASSSSFENPCELVRTTCRKWMEEEGLVEIIGKDDAGDGDTTGWDRNECTQQDPSKAGRCSVRIRFDRLPALANEIIMQRQQPAATTTASGTNESSNDKKNSDGDDVTSSWIEWDTEGWHYSGVGFEGTDNERRERIALYLLALDAINFCFWPLPDGNGRDDAAATGNNNVNNLLEYEHLAMALKKMAEADHTKKDNLEDQNDYAFSAKNLSTMTPEKMIDSLQPCLDQQKYPLPNLEKRAQLWKEVGEGLLQDYNGSALALLDRADQDAPRLVELIATSFPGFRDEVYITSQQQEKVVFLKRAQIFVGDINAALNLKLKGMERLTTFADYRVPQILRHWGVLEYAPGPNGLATKVDHQIEIDSGSYDEISIRAATVVGVEELVRILNQNKNDGNKSDNTVFTDVTVDWYLWQVGERMHQEGIMKPFHKVRTHFY